MILYNYRDMETGTEFYCSLKPEDMADVLMTYYRVGMANRSSKDSVKISNSRSDFNFDNPDAQYSLEIEEMD